MAAPEVQVSSSAFGQVLHPVNPQTQQFDYTVLNNMQAQSTITITRTRPCSYFWMAIFVTFCCCCCCSLPFGLIGVIYSVDSKHRFDRGDDVGAANSAALARNWSIVGLVIGIVFIIITVALQVTLNNY